MKTPIFASKYKKIADVTRDHDWIAGPGRLPALRRLRIHTSAHVHVTSVRPPPTAMGARAAVKHATWITWTPGVPTSDIPVESLVGLPMHRNSATRKLELEELCRIISKCSGSSGVSRVRALRGWYSMAWSTLSAEATRAIHATVSTTIASSTLFVNVQASKIPFEL